MKHQPCIVFLGGYPYPSRLSDGYYQRINSINQQLSEFLQIHIDRKNLPHNKHWLDQPKPGVLTISIRNNWLGRFISILSIIIAKRLYVHSIFPLKNLVWLLKLPNVNKVIDLHGAVPEEQLLKNDIIASSTLGKLEKVAIEKADYYIFVSKAMVNHFSSKYHKEFNSNYSIIPIIPDLTTNEIQKPPLPKIPLVIYAGGLQKWQNIQKMIGIIGKTLTKYKFTIFTTNPEEVRSIFAGKGITGNTIEISSKPHHELLQIYIHCHFGFLLRDNNIVNQVACPTKLIEYIAFGVIPILEYTKIGDFASMGMQFISTTDFLNKNIPDPETINDMIDRNFQIYQSLLKQFYNGVQTLQEYLRNVLL